MNREAGRARRKAAAAPAMAVLLLLMGADAPESCATLEDAAQRLACYDERAKAAPTEPAAGTTPAPPAPAATAPVEPGRTEWEQDSFGKPDGGADSMASSIVGKFTEWGPGTPLTLANGQHWVVMEDRKYFYPKVPMNPEVVIKRGMFGYSMEITALGRRVKVKRID